MTRDLQPAIRRVARGLLFGALFTFLLGSWMGQTRVIEECDDSGACGELLVSGGSSGRVMFVLAAVLFGAAVFSALLSVWLKRRREESPSSF